MIRDLKNAEAAGSSGGLEKFKASLACVAGRYAFFKVVDDWVKKTMRTLISQWKSPREMKKRRQN